MYTEEKLRRVNKIIKDMIFECKGEIHSGMFVTVEYQFQITGVKKMISVGEWYDFLVVDVTIVDGDKRFDVLSKIMPEFVIKEYRLLVNLDRSISEELEYFFDGSQPRIHIPNGGVKLSQEYLEKLDNFNINKNDL